MRIKLPVDVWSVIAIDGLVVFFAIWTLCCHTLLFFNGNTLELLSLSGYVFFFCAVFFLRMVRRGRWSGSIDAIRSDDRAVVPSLNTRPDQIAAVIGLIAATVILWVCKEQQDAWLFFGSAFGFALLSSAWLLSRPAVTASSSLPNEQRPQWQYIALWVLALSAAYITLVMRLPNSDDALYVHIAVSAADRPFVTPIATDTLHNIGVNPSIYYRLHSYELLAGVISLVSGLPAIEIIHLGFATIAGLLTPLAWARLFRLLDPQRWFWMVLVVFCWYLADGTTAYSPPMHAFARLFQGKAILLTIGIPLIVAYGIRFSLQPSWNRFWMLVASQVAAIGLSSTGIWVAPVVAMVSVCVPFQFRLGQLKVIGLGLLSCFYVVGIGLWLRTQMIDSGPESAPTVILSSLTRTSDPSFSWIEGSLKTIFGRNSTYLHAPLYYAYCSVIFLSWPLAHTQLAKRYLVAFSLVFIAVLANPYLYRIVIRNMTGSATYNRVVFILPTAVALAVCFTSLLHVFRSKPLQILSIAVCVICLYLFLTEIPNRTVIKATHMGFYPTLKVNYRRFDTALEVAQMFPQDSYVLSTGSIAMYIPMVHTHPYLVMVKEKWFGNRHPGRVARFRIRRIVDGKKKPLRGRHRYWFLKQLNQFRVEGIISSVRCEKVEGFLETMEHGGFHLLKRIDSYYIWRRQRPR